MARILSPSPVKLFVAMLASRPEGFDRAEQLLADRYGPVDHRSDPLPFDFTRYYQREMGPSLLRRFVSFRDLALPGHLAAIKCATNEMEQVLARALHAAVPRPVNLDPGYLDAAKVVLASAKDYTHRLYLADGIYAEVTLHYREGRWQPWPWTYPDYRTEAYHAFFATVRETYLTQRQGHPPTA